MSGRPPLGHLQGLRQRRSVAGAAATRGAARRRGGLIAAARALAAALALLAGLAAAAGAAPPPPRRIVAVAPSAVELLYALGLGERVVGVGDQVGWPPAATRLPRLGGLLDPRLETVAALRPDLAVLLPSERELAERLAALGIEVLVVPHESLEDVERAALRVAERAGVPEAGARFAAAWRADLAPAPLPGRPRVLLLAAREPGDLAHLLVAGPGTFLDQLLQRLGASNAFADAPLRWPQVPLEEVVARRPEVIVELVPRALAAGEVAALQADWQRLPAFAGAGRAPRVVVIGADYALLPGPRLPQLYRQLRAALAAAPPATAAGPAPAARPTP